MRLLSLFSAASRRTVTIALVMLAISSLATSGQLALINQASLNTSSTTFRIVIAVAFVALLVGGFVLRWRAAARLMAEVELALLDRRRRLFDQIRAAGLRTFEQIDGLTASFSRDIEQLAALTPVLIDCMSYGMMLAGFGFSLFVLSPMGALVWAATIALLSFYLYGQRDQIQKASNYLDLVWPRQRRLVEQLTRGFAQLKMDSAAAQALQAESLAARHELDEAQRYRFGFAYRAPIAATTIFYLGLAVLLFFEPVRQAVKPEVQFQVVTILFFSITAASFLVRELSSFITAEQALVRLETVEAELAGATSDRETPMSEKMTAHTTFTSIELRGVVFSYVDQDLKTFTVGPIDLRLTPGEVVFITGSNGSGKTTLMKLMTGLYKPGRGQLWLDGSPITAHSRDSYRTLFTSVFMDHHLFGPAYGLDVSDPVRVDALLRQFNLEGVVHFENGRFAPLDLSTGQSKRLALVVALLEDRPIYVLDEWAAHQDPYLRRYFYETLVPALRAAGKTVVAISHDARFFHLADRRLHLRNGQVSEAPSKAQPARI